MFDIKNAFPESSSTGSENFQFRLRLGNAHPSDECTPECRKLAPVGDLVTCFPYVCRACCGCFRADGARRGRPINAWKAYLRPHHYLATQSRTCTQVHAQWLLRRAGPSSATCVPPGPVQVVPIPLGASGDRRPQDHLPPAVASSSSAAPAPSTSALPLSLAASAAHTPTTSAAAAAAAVMAAVGVRDGSSPTTAAVATAAAAAAAVAATGAWTCTPDSIRGRGRPASRRGGQRGAGAHGRRPLSGRGVPDEQASSRSTPLCVFACKAGSPGHTCHALEWPCDERG